MSDNLKLPGSKVAVAIHQPNFFPWLGYFDKIVQSDVFIFLDHVQYPKTGGMWCNRVKLLVDGGGRWVTAPINRSFHGVRAIKDMEFKLGDSWRDRFVDLLLRHYRDAPFFAETFEWLRPLIMNPENNIAAYNFNVVLTIAAKLGMLPTKFRRSSEMIVEAHSNEMLIALSRQVGGGVYVCGGGAADYQDDELFADAGLVVRHQSFVHPSYKQSLTQSFVPGLSIVDPLMFCGIERVMTMLQGKVSLT
jgi:hypothetical protein